MVHTLGVYDMNQALEGFALAVFDANREYLPVGVLDLLYCRLEYIASHITKSTSVYLALEFSVIYHKCLFRDWGECEDSNLRSWPT